MIRIFYNNLHLCQDQFWRIRLNPQDSQNFKNKKVTIKLEKFNIYALNTKVEIDLLPSIKFVFKLLDLVIVVQISNRYFIPWSECGI